MHPLQFPHKDGTQLMKTINLSRKPLKYTYILAYLDKLVLVRLGLLGALERVHGIPSMVEIMRLRALDLDKQKP
jgi:hypothetical protein